MVKTSDFESDNSGSSPGEAAKLNFRLRLTAEAIPHELWTWLNPLLIEAAEEIERLKEIEEAYDYVQSRALDI